MYFHTTQHVDVGAVIEGAPLADVLDGQLWLWPRGKGFGPGIALNREEWALLRDAAEAAYADAEASDAVV